VLLHHQQTHPKFGYGNKYSGVPKKFKKTIYAADSTTTKLVANCMDWAKHRRKKAVAKCHMTLNLQSFLPHFASVKSAANNDAKEAKKLCNTLKDGEIVVFDKAYFDYAHLYEFESRRIFWVTRSKKNMKYNIVGQHSKPKKNIHKDIIIELGNKFTASAYSKPFRLVEATVLLDGEEKQLTFITNNMVWSSNSICDLYKCRWGVEVFFKQIKRTLQLADFLGQSENAVRWQIWIALLTYILIRLISYTSKWSGSFPGCLHYFEERCGTDSTFPV
jgi:IS4 transposase